MVLHGFACRMVAEPPAPRSLGPLRAPSSPGFTGFWNQLRPLGALASPKSPWVAPGVPWGPQRPHFQGPIGALEGRAMGPILDGFTMVFQWWNAMQSDASTFMLMGFCQPVVPTVAVVQMNSAEPTPATSAVLTTLNPPSHPGTQLHLQLLPNTITEGH